MLVIVVTYNGEKWIRNCLASVAPEKGVDGVVVDNGSTDGTVETVRREFPHVAVVQTGKNIGFGRANNIGLRMALEKGYEYAYLLNQDAWILPDDIKKLMEAARRHPEYGIVSPIHVYSDMAELDDCFRKAVPKTLIDGSMLAANMEGAIYQTKKNIPAAHWLLNLNVVREVGGFSPTFFHFGEDDNLTHRMLFRGYKCGIVPSVCAVHDRKSRVKDKDAILKLTKGYWLLTLSDINISRSARLRRMATSVFYTGLSHPGWTLKNALAIVGRYRTIRANREMSKKESAFL